MNAISNVILVHGAWADGSSWAKVLPLLAEKGLAATAVQLPLSSFEAVDDSRKERIGTSVESHQVGAPTMTKS